MTCSAAAPSTTILRSGDRFLKRPAACPVLLLREHLHRHRQIPARGSQVGPPPPDVGKGGVPGGGQDVRPLRGPLVGTGGAGRRSQQSQTQRQNQTQQEDAALDFSHKKTPPFFVVVRRPEPPRRGGKICQNYYNPVKKGMQPWRLRMLTPSLPLSPATVQSPGRGPHRPGASPAQRGYPEGTGG